MSNCGYIKLCVCIAAVGVVIAIVYMLLRSSTRDNFDIRTDPVRGPAYKRNIYTCPTPLKAQGNGLITQNGGADYTICDFVQKFKDKIAYPEDDPYDVAPRLFCSTMYDNFHEDFSDRWESLGVCEQDVKEQMKKCVTFA